MLHHATHHATVLKLIFAELGARGFDTGSLCRGLGSMADAVNDPATRISAHQANAVVERAIRLARDAMLGHRVGVRRTHVATGALGLALATASTLQQAVELMADHRRAMGNVLDARTELDASGTLHIAFVPSGIGEVSDRVRRFWEDEAVTSTVALLRHISRCAFSPDAVAWTSAAPPPEQSLAGYFEAPMAYGQAQARISINGKWRDTPLPTADPVVHRHILAMLGHESQRETTPDLCVAIERLIQQRLASPPTFDEVARTLNTSTRTLRRRLTDRHTSFQNLIDGVHRTHAINRLRDPDASLSTIASELGYSDVKNFRRAVKRLTGTVPSLIRERGEPGCPRLPSC